MPPNGNINNVIIIVFYTFPTPYPIGQSYPYPVVIIIYILNQTGRFQTPAKLDLS